MLILYSNPTAAALLARRLARRGLEVRTGAQGRRADVALVEWESGRCWELLEQATGAARRILLLHKSGPLPKGGFAAALPLPVDVERLCQLIQELAKGDQCNAVVS